MKLFLIFLCLMIYLGQVSEGHLPQDEGTQEVYHGLEGSLEANELEVNRKARNPKSAVLGCPRGFFKSGSECFRRLSHQTTWDEASQACADNDLSLAEPEDFQTLAEYLYNTYTTTMRKPSYWIGVLFGPNNDTVQWASGGELQNPPWYDSTHHRCDYEHLRIGFSAKIHCHTDNWCLYCSPNRGESYGTFPLCEYEPIYEFECSPECIHGKCIGPNQCECEPEWTGPLCNEHDCFQVGSKSFRTLQSYRILGSEASQVCAQFNHSLAEPEDLRAVAKYIYERKGHQHYGQHFWIGAYTETNGTVQWASGGVIGPDAPYWGRPTGHQRCTQQPMAMCMVLLVRLDCITDNTCLFCLPCETAWVKRAPLCECDPIY